MDPRLLRYYTRELQHIREMGGEFAKEFPKIAGRLGLEGFECADPYVERLLEGFAFLAARVQLKIDAEFPRFTQHLLEIVYPHYLAPTPSMAVVQFQPDLNEGSLAAGVLVPRGTALRSLLGKSDQTPCEYRSAHDVTLWPMTLIEAKYFTYTGELAGIELQQLPGIKAGLRLRFRTAAGLRFDQLALDRLCLYLRGSDEVPMQIYERLLANAVGMVVLPASRPATWHQLLDKSCIRRVGFNDEQALLPFGPRSFHGYRLLHEYFAFPQRYLFIELTGLQAAVRRCPEAEIEVVLLLRRSDAFLESAIDASDFALYATPAVNLFPKRTDRIHLSDQQSEYHVVADRTRPMDFEVYQVTAVTGYGAGADSEMEFLPFYFSNDLSDGVERKAYYQVHRIPRLLSSRQRRQGPRASYIGSEVYVSLVDALQPPYRSDLRQLGFQTLCTNRDLPLAMPVGVGKTDFTMESGAPVEAVRCLSGPTKPAPSFATVGAETAGDISWRLISLMSLNYLSLLDNDETRGAAALRELLRLYSGVAEAAIQKQIEGVRSVTSQPIVRRIPAPGPVTYGRGLEVSVTFDDAAFEGTGMFLFGGVLEQFFSEYVSVNSFTETVVKSVNRGEIMRWQARIGQRHTV